MRHHLLILFLILCSLSKLTAARECCGKIDVAPVYLRVNMIEGHKTVEKMNMGGGRIDASINVWKGILIKPSFLYASGDGKLDAETLGVGVCWKVNDRLTLTPNIGYAHSRLSTHVHPKELPGFSLKTKFHSNGGFIGLDLYFTVIKDWRLIAVAQYAWAATQTKIKHLETFNGHSSGGNYALGIEYDLNSCWSVNLVGAYNSSLSHEKDGTRVYGAKLGITRWLYWN